LWLTTVFRGDVDTVLRCARSPSTFRRGLLSQTRTATARRRVILSDARTLPSFRAVHKSLRTVLMSDTGKPASFQRKLLW
jgi:hypothetical protein